MSFEIKSSKRPSHYRLLFVEIFDFLDLVLGLFLMAKSTVLERLDLSFFFFFFFELFSFFSNLIKSISDFTRFDLVLKYAFSFAFFLRGGRRI